MSFILVIRSMFELTQEPMRFVVTHQESSVELLFMIADQCLCNKKKSKFNLFIIKSD